jgi:hypothetical protein
MTVSKANLSAFRNADQSALWAALLALAVISVSVQTFSAAFLIFTCRVRGNNIPDTGRLPLNGEPEVSVRAKGAAARSITTWSDRHFLVRSSLLHPDRG